MPLPEGWDGIFWGPDDGGHLIFDMEAPAFADLLVEQEPGQAACLVANAVFDLYWNGQIDRAREFSVEGTKRWPEKPYALVPFFCVATKLMIQSGCDERSARSGASNTMGQFFGGLVMFHVDAKDIIDYDNAIEFEFENVLYFVNPIAYEVGIICLPDGRLLQADSWLEALPPQPEGLEVIEVPRARKADSGMKL